MKVKKTNRGFDYADFKDVNGTGCSIQKSSAAMIDAIWLGVNDADPKVLASQAPSLGVNTEEINGWVEYPIPEGVSLITRMHLNQKQVKKLLPYLIKFAETGDIT